MERFKWILITAGLILLIYVINLIMPESRLGKSRMVNEIHRKQKHYGK